MDTYKTSRDRFRQQDVIADQMRKSQRKLGKRERRRLFEIAVTALLTDKQREQGKGA